MNPFSSQSRSPADFVREARTLQGNGQTEAAIQQLQTAVAYYPSDERVNRELIAHFARLDRYMDAFRAAVAWYRNDGGNPNCLDTLADIADVLGEKADAEKWRAQAAAMRPSSGGFGSKPFSANQSSSGGTFGGFGGFGQTPQAPTPSPSFGNNSGFGNFANPSTSSAFGQTPSPSGFGSFGNANAPSFGNAKPSQPSFGNANAPTFGNANAPSFGNYNANPSQPSFGNANGSSNFGNTGFGNAGTGFAAQQQVPVRSAGPAATPATSFTFMATCSCRTEDETVRASLVLGSFVKAFREDAGIHLSLVIDGAAERPDYAQIIQQHTESLDQAGNASRITLTFS